MSPGPSAHSFLPGTAKSCGNLAIVTSFLTTGQLGLWFTVINSLMTDQEAINVHLKPWLSVCSREPTVHLPNEEKCVKHLKAGGMSICDLLECLEVYISFPLVSLKMDTTVLVCILEWKEPRHKAVTTCYVRRTTKCQRMILVMLFAINQSNWGWTY